MLRLVVLATLAASSLALHCTQQPDLTVRIVLFALCVR